MTAKAFFRLLLASLIVISIAAVLAAVFPGNISEDWRTLTEWHGKGGYYEYFESFTLPTNTLAKVALLVLLVVILVGLISVYVGLFLFWRFARLANVALTVLYLVLTPWAGIVVLLPLETGFYDLSMLCQGAVIALSYTAPIKDYFERR